MLEVGHALGNDRLGTLELCAQRPAVIGVRDPDHGGVLQPGRVIDPLQDASEQCNVRLKDDDDAGLLEQGGQMLDVVAGAEPQDDDDRVLENVALLGETPGLVKRPMAAAQGGSIEDDGRNALCCRLELDIRARTGVGELLGEVRIPLAEAVDIARQSRRRSDRLRH